HQLARELRAERLQHEALHRAVLGPPLRLGLAGVRRAARGDDHQPRLAQLVRRVAEQLARLGAGEVEVLEQQHQRATLERRLAQLVAEAAVEAVALALFTWAEDALQLLELEAEVAQRAAHRPQRLGPGGDG